MSPRSPKSAEAETLRAENADLKQRVEAQEKRIWGLTGAVVGLQNTTPLSETTPGGGGRGRGLSEDSDADTLSPRPSADENQCLSSGFSFSPRSPLASPATPATGGVGKVRGKVDSPNRRPTMQLLNFEDLENTIDGEEDDGGDGGGGEDEDDEDDDDDDDDDEDDEDAKQFSAT